MLRKCAEAPDEIGHLFAGPQTEQRLDIGGIYVRHLVEYPRPDERTEWGFGLIEMMEELCRQNDSVAEGTALLHDILEALKTQPDEVVCLVNENQSTQLA